MTNKILATFRIDPSEWEAFKNAANADGTNASALLIEYVRTYPTKNTVESPPTATDTHLDTMVYMSHDEIGMRLDNLEARLDEVPDYNLTQKCLETHLDKRIDEMRLQVEAQLESLRGKLKARLVR